MEIKKGDVIGLKPADRDPVTGNYEGRCANSDYTYILPAAKVCFLNNDDFRWTAIVEKIDKENKKIYVSQTNWLFMQHIIKFLYNDVKIEKRYPGRLTLATLRDPLLNEKINKEDIKKLSQMIGEKIVIKTSKEEIKIPSMKITGGETVSSPDKSNNKGLPETATDEEEELKKLINYFAGKGNGRVVKNKVQFILAETATVKFIRVSDVSYRNAYFEKTYTNYTEKMQVLRESGIIFLGLILKGKSL